MSEENLALYIHNREVMSRLEDLNGITSVIKSVEEDMRKMKKDVLIRPSMIPLICDRKFESTESMLSHLRDRQQTMRTLLKLAVKRAKSQIMEDKMSKYTDFLNYSQISSKR